MDLAFNISNELLKSPYCSPSVFEQNSTMESHRSPEFLPGRVMLLTGMSLIVFFLFLIRRQVKTVEGTYQLEDSGTIPKKSESQSDYLVSVHSSYSADNMESMKKKIAIQDEMLKKLITLEIKLTELEKILISKYGNKTPVSS
ncbi:uncharacterized protein LOC109916234 [Rhincodon typus]|uniref:uncharacterized protein LOC109916234 n=1 Tax=Rhincodon typus TaxID=259920 RepID=UPI00202F8812|nr:uncharacterized protein LOC109916234 [Rhincodon typus]